jgi:hypothetical protein
MMTTQMTVLTQHQVLLVLLVLLLVVLALLLRVMTTKRMKTLTQKQQVRYTWVQNSVP